jgi:RNA polymerase sigma factor (sigma-70 family)
MSKSEGSSATQRTHSFAAQAVREYADQLKSYLARHLRRPHDVDDLTQQVYLRLIRMSISPNDIQEPVAFVHGVAKRVLTTYWMAHYREAEQFPSEGQATDVCVDLPSEHLRDNPEDALDLELQLLDGLKELPPVHAACMVLFYRDQLSRKEVARKLGLQPDTVKKYLTDGRARLRKRLVTEGNQG